MGSGGSAVELLASFRARALSPVETMRSAIDRIEVVNPIIKALTALCFERASEEARASEARYANGTARPLEGVPFVAKDLLDSADVPTAYGSRLFENHVPTHDAAAIRRLREAGAILVGKAATHEFAWGLTTSSALHGQTRNPWDLNRIPGGSSGGSAAALAAGLVPLAVGTDTAGSIRIPSAFCGTAGLKPSRGRVPATGCFALAPSLDHVGPMARAASDLPGVLSVLDGTCGGVDRLSPPESADLRGVRILVIEDLYPISLAPDHAKCFADLYAHLQGLGVEVIEARWPLNEARDPYGILVPTLNAEARLIYHARLGLYPGLAGEYSPDVRDRLQLAHRYELAEYADAAVRRVEFAAALMNMMMSVDAMISPISALSPPLIGEDMSRIDHDSGCVELREAVMGFCAPQSLTGLPACAIRAGFDRFGLPVGAQLTGRFGDDRRLLRMAAMLERSLGIAEASCAALA